MTKALVVDFDGVVVRRSEFFKQDAWPHVFAAYGENYHEHFKNAEEQFGSGRGGDRFDILRETYRGLGEPEESVAERVQTGAEMFDGYVQEKIREAGADPDVIAVLEVIAKKMPVYVNSATPVDALARTVKNLAIDHIFTGVLGRPNNKVQNFTLVAEGESIVSSDMLFVGDSPSDAKAAADYGCQFVGYANEWNKWKGSKQSFPVIESFSELEELLNKTNI